MTDLVQLLEAEKKSFETRVKEQLPSITTEHGDWADDLAQHEQEYEEASNRISSHEKTLRQIERLEEELSNKRSELAKIGDRLALENPQQRVGDFINQLRECDQSLVALQQSELEKLEDLSNGFASAHLQHPIEVDTVFETLRNALRGSNMQRNTIRELLRSHVTEGEGIAAWWELIADLVELWRWATQHQCGEEHKPVTTWEEFYTGELSKLASALEPAELSALVRLPLTPKFEVELTPDRSAVDFQNASQGQQATVLLLTLMNQELGPLIIDQPEDDLDNRIINRIIEAIRAAKPQRQLIFATHNANLVVNGDSELVVELEGGRISQLGAIDTAGVRESITQTLEGGKRAFELRRMKYDF